MKRHFLKVFLLSALMATTGMMFTSCKDYDDDISSVNDRIDKLENDKIGSVDEQIAAIKSSISSLENAYKAADAELKSALEKQATDLAAAKSELEAAIQSQKKSLDGDIEKLTGDLTALSNKVEDYNSALSNKIEGYNTSLSAEIKKVADGLATTKSELEKIKSSHDADIQKLTGDLTTLSNKVEGYNTSLAADIKKVADDLKANHYTKTEIDAKLAELDKKFNNSIEASLAELDAKFAGEIAGLNSRIGQCEGAILAIDAQIKTMQGLIDGKVDQSDFDVLDGLVKTIEGDVQTIQGQLKTIEGQIANKANQSDLDALSAKHSALSAKHDALSELVETMQGQIQTMQDQIAGKVDKTEYETFTQLTNGAIQENTKAISVLDALCAGFGEGTTIKNYIDEAKKSVVAMLDSYVLKETYESFVKEYGTFKTDIESKVSGNTAKITALESWKEELTKEGGTLDQLEEKLQTAIKEKTTLADVKATYNKECTEFLAGVNAIITDALAEDGIIGKELQTKLDALNKELTDKIDALNTRMEVAEGQLEALVGQIQSLVYVPEFADGTTEMPCYTFGDNTIAAPVVLKFRVSPATMAAKMAGLNDAGALSLVTEEVKTRAGEAPTATITGVEVVEAATGTFTVSAKIENYPADAKKAVAIALAVKADIDETGVSNDVVSNFAGVVKAADAELQFALYGDENKYDANATIEIPWNTTKEESKCEILKGLELKVSLNGGTDYISLEEASAIIGETLVASTYTTTSTPAKTNSEFEITNVTDAEWGGETYPSVQFASANGTSALVGKTVVFDYTIKAKLGENDAADALTGKVTYKPVKDNVTLTFEKVTLPWTYEFVKNGLGAKDGSDTKTPAVSGKFDKVTLTGLPEGADLSEVLSGTLTKKIKVDGEDVSTTADFTVAAGEEEGKIKITVDAEKYEWGKTYDIEYTYTKDESVYVLSGSIEFGVAPADVKYDQAVTVGYEDKTIIDGMWKTVYEDWKAKNEGNTAFTGNTQFAEAIFAGTQKPTPVTSTKLINAKNPEPGKDVEETNGTKITAEGGMLKGELKKADITAEDDKFVQTATWTTWYGQKITVTLTYKVDLPDYTLKASEAYVKDGVIGTTGEVDPTDEKWTVKLEGAIKDYFSFTPASDEVKKTFKKKSVDGNGKVFADVTEGEDPKVTWTSGKTTEKDLDMTVELVLGENTVVASEDFTIKADDPIKTFETKKLEVMYQANKELDVNLLKGISMIDFNGQNWINEDGTLHKTTTNQYTAKTVFSMTTGNDTTAGIQFGTPTNEDGLTFTIEDNKLKYAFDATKLQKDVTVTIPAKITYWLGEKETTITVVVKVAE